MAIPDQSYLNDPELVAIEHKRLSLLLQLKSLRKNNGLAFYEPHKKQQGFHEAANFPYRYARTGNRFGKSQMGSAEDMSFAFGERTWYPKGDPRRTLGIPPFATKGMIICVDWDKSSEIFTNVEGQGELGKLFQYMPDGAYKGCTKNHSGHIDKIIVSRPRELGGGESVICIETVQSYKQSNLSLESSVWDWIHVDEPCPKGMFVAAARGLVDRKGKCWFTCTPLAEAWINDLFVESRRTQLDDGLPHIQGTEKWMMVGSMYDNPYNTDEACDRFLALIDNPDEIQCRKLGIPLSMAGIVYKEFDHFQHIYRTVPFGWEDFGVPPKDYTIRLSIDPHPQTPHAVVFAATSPFGYNFIFREIFEQELVPDLCTMIKAYTNGYYVQDCVIDPMANTRDPITGETLMDEFFRNGVFCDPATKDLTAGILSVKRHLRARTASGKPTMLFSGELKRLPWEMDHYNWKTDSSNKPEDKNDHTLECLYRLCLRGLTYNEPPTEGAWARERAKEIDDVIMEELDDETLFDTKVSGNSRDFGTFRHKTRKDKFNE